MTRVASLRSGAWCGSFAGLAGLVLIGVTGCASDQSKPSAQPVTGDQVRGHADKVFENLQQEEKRPAPEVGGPMY